MSDEGAPLIKKYSCSKTAEGYNFVIIINNEKDASVKEEHSFQKFENISLVAPEQGNSF